MEKLYTETEVLKIHDEAFEDGKRHQKPSPETQKFMVKIEMEISNIHDKLKQMPTKDEMKVANLELIEEVMKRSEKKFASKRTENIVYAMVGLVLTFVLGKLLNLI